MLPLRIPRPERADGTVLAALLAVLLALMLAAQLVLPQDRPAVPDVPPATLRSGPVSVPAISADPVLARRSIFQPTRMAGSGGDGAGCTGRAAWAAPRPQASCGCAARRGWCSRPPAAAA